MASALWAALADGGGLSGQAVRGAVEGSATAAPAQTLSGLKSAGEQAGSMAADLAGRATEQAASAAGSVAAEAGRQASSLGQSSFSWSGYAQAVGILFLLLAALWLAVWLLRRYGRFNFLPRPGALPRGSLVMEAQLPLGPRKGLMVVRFLNKRLLLGLTDQQITLLSEEQVRHEPDNADFQHIMDEARRGPDDR